MSPAKRKTTTAKAPAKRATTASKTTKAKAAPKPATKTTAAKPKTAKTAAQSAKAPAAQAAKPAVVNPPHPVVVGPIMRKKEIVEKTVLRTGMKKRDVKPVVEAMLGVLGEALAEGREVVAPPLGKVRAHKQKTTAKKRILFAKLHQNLPPPAADTQTDDPTDP